MASEARVRATYHAAVDDVPELLASIRALCSGETNLNLRESTYREPAFAQKRALAEEQQKEQAAKERDDKALEQDEKVHNATRVVSETNTGGSQRPPPQGGYKRAREKTLKAAEAAALARQKLETEAAAAAECCVLRSDGVEECVLRIPAPTKENLKGVSRRAGVRARKETLVAAGANAAAFLEAAFGFELQHELVDDRPRRHRRLLREAVDDLREQLVLDRGALLDLVRGGRRLHARRRRARAGDARADEDGREAAEGEEVYHNCGGAVAVEDGSDASKSTAISRTAVELARGRDRRAAQ